MTIYLIKLQEIDMEAYNFIHTFDHVQLDTNVIAVDTEISLEELTKKFTFCAKSIEVIISGKVFDEFELTWPVLKWLQKRGF